LVCDGFVGNILLKTAEGAFSLLFKKVKGALMSNLKTKIGAMLVKGKLKGLRKMEEEVGGSVFLGIKKPIIKAHGNSNANAFMNAVLLAKRSTRIDLAEQITNALDGVVIDE